jgi:hypothetical protein
MMVVVKDVVEDWERRRLPGLQEIGQVLKCSSKILFKVSVQKEWMSVNDFHELGSSAGV